jgi:predicted nuclease with TOPRIM domain
MPNENQNPNQVANLLNIESLINASTARFDNLQKEFQDLKSQLDSVLESDNEYQEVFQEAQKQAKLKTVAKQKVMARPECSQLVEKIKDAQLQLKELKTALSDYLSQFVILSGTNQIEGADGILRQIIYSAKLVKTK